MEHARRVLVKDDELALSVIDADSTRGVGTDLKRYIQCCLAVYRSCGDSSASDTGGVTKSRHSVVERRTPHRTNALPDAPCGASE